MYDFERPETEKRDLRENQKETNFSTINSATPWLTVELLQLFEDQTAIRTANWEVFRSGADLGR